MTAADNLDHVKEDQTMLDDPSWTVPPPGGHAPSASDQDAQTHLHAGTRERPMAHAHPWEGSHEHPPTPDETGAPLEDLPEVRLEQFRRTHEIVPIAVEELEGFANDLLRQGYERGRAKVRKEPEVWTAADELSAVKYAQEHGYITDLEAQRKVRKLLRLKGKRVLAVKRRRATRRAR